MITFQIEHGFQEPAQFLVSDTGVSQCEGVD